MAKITFEESLGRNEWIHKELMQSLTGEVLDTATKDQFYEVKLLVNGIELEPKFFNDLMDNIEKYIDREASEIVRDKLDQAVNKAQKLEKIVKEATYNIMGEFKIEGDVDDY